MNKKRFINFVAVCVFVILCIVFFGINQKVNKQQEEIIQTRQELQEQKEQLDKDAQSLDKTHILIKDCDNFMNKVYKDMYNYTILNLNDGNIDSQEAEKELSDLALVTKGKYNEFIEKSKDVYTDDMTEEQKSQIKKELDLYDEKFNNRLETLNKTIRYIHSHKQIQLDIIQ